MSIPGSAPLPHHARRETALARAAVGRLRDGVDRAAHLRIGHDDDEVLGAAERLHALAVGRGGLVHVLRDGARADERHAHDVGVREDGVDRLLAAVDEVEHARREARGRDQLEHELL
jgi:hypothetical protein